ncbi:sulfatase [Wenyingzhuangia fucanilytica]|uniref:Sulfatase n=1 Tax=Wenyingzhuangia fucanilytica TaxID=1790137 RepID=A0A1B1Y9P1_9FLAO|nr:sulfatase [Wenyingzhuangia fucanilytica]ANW97501.1 sulfatase [Wenyingzhuangia fucanilytica]
MKINKLFNSLFVVATAMLVLSCSSSKSTNNTAQAGKSPNVIYIMADDLTTQAISAYGGIYKDIAPTPNIDRLAKEGMLFQNSICTNAICGPSRSSILTGNYSHVNGYYKNESGGKFDETKWTFPREFQSKGYATSLFGKWHLGSEPKGFDAFKFHNSAGQQGHYWDPVFNENGKDVKHTGYATNLTTDFALDWLKSNKDTDKPFMMCLQYKAPHRPWEPDHKYETLWDDIEMPYPATFNDDYKGRELTAGDTEMTMEFFSRKDMKLPQPKEGFKDWRERMEWQFFGSKPDEVVLPEGVTEDGPEARKWRYQTYIKDYLACVKSVDDNIGKVLAYLDENGLVENTVVVLTSDQGFYLGDHGFFDKRFIYEESLRMPLIVRYPKKVKAGVVCEDIVKNIDYAPTLLDIAGIQSEQKMQGKSFASMLTKQKAPKNWEEKAYYHYYEYPFWHHVQPHYGIRTERYTLAHFYYNVDVWELYDNKKDPMQMNNVINDPAYADVIKDLKAQLKGLMVEYKNDRPLEELRVITDTDFGSLVENGENVTVQKMISAKYRDKNKEESNEDTEE